MKNINRCLQFGLFFLAFTILALFSSTIFNIRHGPQLVKKIWSSGPVFTKTKTLDKHKSNLKFENTDPALKPYKDAKGTVRAEYDSDVKVYADRQFQHYKQHNTKEDFDRFTETSLPLMQYSVNYQTNENTMHIAIKETFINGSFSKGGSYFYTKQEWRLDRNLYYRSLCALEEDYFNGSYSASCLLRQPCSRVTIQRFYVGFHGFQSSGSKVQRFINRETKLIWDKEVCIRKNTQSSSNYEFDSNNNIIISEQNHHSSRNELTVRRALIGKANKRKYRFSWNITAPDQKTKVSCSHLFVNEKLVHLDDRTKCEKFEKYDQVLVYGASHIDWAHRYWKKLCPNASITFDWPLYMPLIKEKTLTTLKRYENTSESILIILQVGSHDAVYMPTYTVLIKNVEILKVLVSEIDQYLSKLPTVDVYMLSPPPHPTAHYTSNAIVSAFSYQMQQICSHSLVRFYDFFTPLFACYNDVPDVKEVHRNGEVGRNEVHYFMEEKGIGGDVFTHFVQQMK